MPRGSPLPGAFSQVEDPGSVLEEATNGRTVLAGASVGGDRGAAQGRYAGRDGDEVIGLKTGVQVPAIVACGGRGSSAHARSLMGPPVARVGREAADHAGTLCPATRR